MSMNILKKIGMVFVLLLTISATSVMAGDLQSSQEEILNKAEEILKQSEVTNDCRKTYNRLVLNGEGIGVLWGSYEKESLNLGKPFVAKWGIRVPLYSGKELVGQIFLENKPPGWEHDWKKSRNYYDMLNGQNGFHRDFERQGLHRGYGGDRT